MSSRICEIDNIPNSYQKELPGNQEKPFSTHSNSFNTLEKKIAFSPKLTTPLSNGSDLQDRCEKYGDDSSDEEENNEIRKIHSTERSFGKILPDVTIPSDNKLSILLHMLGLDLLHSPLVENIYYFNKSRILGDCQLLTTENKVKSAIKEAFRTIVEPKELYSDFEASHEKFIAEIVDEILLHKRFIYKTEYRLPKDASEKSYYFKKIQPSLSRLYSELASFAKSYAQQQPIEESTYSFSAIDLTNKKSIEFFWKQIEPPLIEEMKELKIVGDDDETIGCYSEASNKSKSDKEKNQIYDNIQVDTLASLCQLAFKTIKKSKKGNIKNVLSKDKKNLTTELIAGLLATEEKKPTSPVKKNPKDRQTRSQDPEQPTDRKQIKYIIEPTKEVIKPWLEEILSFPKDKKVIIDSKQALKQFESQSEEDFHQRFYKILKTNSVFQWQRSVLSEQFTLVVHNAYDIIAGTRLLNKSQTRSIRQKTQNNGSDFQEVVTRGFSFNVNELCAFDTEEITALKNRSDFVPNLGSYSAIFDKLASLKKDINGSLEQKKQPEITEKHLAQAIRSILNGSAFPLSYEDGSKIELEKRQETPLLRFLVNFTYLLFVTEVARNPASLITNQMILDLIISGSITWQNALADLLLSYEKKPGDSGGSLPMSMKEAVKSARCLHSAYDQYIPYHYKYEGEEAKLSDPSTLELIRREAHVIRSWAKAEKFDIDSQHDELTLKEFFGLIQNRMKTWYKPPIHQTTSRTKSYSTNFFMSGDESKP